jgi:glycosyltransferase involved in cell wall biosynthesis
MTSQPSVSVVVPVAQAAALLPHTAAEHEIVLVDSPTGSDQVAAARAARPDLVLVQPNRPGPGAALACGLRAARNDAVVLLPGDGSADPAEIPRFVQALVAGADVATTDRRPLTARHGCTVFWRDLVPVLDLPDVAIPAPFDGHRLWGDGPEIATVVRYRFAAAGARVVEVPAARRRGTGGRGARPSLRVLRAVLTERHRARARRRGDRALQRAVLAPRPVLIQDLVEAR